MMRFFTLITVVAACVVLASAAQAQVGKPVTTVDPNLASEADLAKLPHMNATISKALVARRPFLSMTTLDEFLRAQGLSRTQLNELYDRMFVHINLNTGTNEEIQLMPRMGPRMRY